MPIERRDPHAAPGQAAPDAEELSAVDDVLDHLLDPLEDVVPTPHAAPPKEEETPDAWPAAEPFEIDYGDGRGSFRDLAARVRWSDRRRFRLARSAARWGVVAAVFSGVMWFIFSLGGPR